MFSIIMSLFLYREVILFFGDVDEMRFMDYIYYSPQRTCAI